MGRHVAVTILRAAEPSCALVEVDGLTVLVDLPPVHLISQFSPNDLCAVVHEVAEHVPSPDVVLCSTAETVAALPVYLRAAEANSRGCSWSPPAIVATDAAAFLGIAIATDVFGAGGSESSRQSFSNRHIEEASRLIERVQYGQQVALPGGCAKVTAVPSGASLGSANFVVESFGTRVGIVCDIKPSHSHASGFDVSHLDGAAGIVLLAPVGAAGSRKAGGLPGSFQDHTRALAAAANERVESACRSVLQQCAAGSDVYIVESPCGLALDLVERIPVLQREAASIQRASAALQSARVCVCSPQARECLSYAGIAYDFLRPARCKSMLQGREAFSYVNDLRDGAVVVLRSLQSSFDDDSANISADASASAFQTMQYVPATAPALEAPMIWIVSPGQFEFGMLPMMRARAQLHRKKPLVAHLHWQSAESELPYRMESDDAELVKYSLDQPLAAAIVRLLVNEMEKSAWVIAAPCAAAAASESSQVATVGQQCRHTIAPARVPLRIDVSCAAPVHMLPLPGAEDGMYGGAIHGRAALENDGATLRELTFLERAHGLSGASTPLLGTFDTRSVSARLRGEFGCEVLVERSVDKVTMVLKNEPDVSIEISRGSPAIRTATESQRRRVLGCLEGAAL